jgi:hypothetical protein
MTCLLPLLFLSQISEPSASLTKADRETSFEVLLQRQVDRANSVQWLKEISVLDFEINTLQKSHWNHALGFGLISTCAGVVTGLLGALFLVPPFRFLGGDGGIPVGAILLTVAAVALIPGIIFLISDLVKQGHNNKHLNDLIDSRASLQAKLSNVVDDGREPPHAEH